MLYKNERHAGLGKTSLKRLLGGIAQHGESSFAKLLLFAALIQIDDDVGVHGIKIVNFAGNKKAEYPLQDTLHWSEWRDSNSRPLEPHSSTLPSCATPRLKTYLQAKNIIPQRQDLSRVYFGFAARLGIGTQYVLDRERKPADPDGRTALKAGLTVENAIDGVLRFLNRHHLVNRIPKQKTDLDFRFMQIHALIGFIEHFSSGTAV